MLEYRTYFHVINSLNKFNLLFFLCTFHDFRVGRYNIMTRHFLFLYFWFLSILLSLRGNLLVSCNNRCLLFKIFLSQIKYILIAFGDNYDIVQFTTYCIELYTLLSNTLFLCFKVTPFLLQRYLLSLNKLLVISYYICTKDI